jgi:superfamily II DNA or RNA helicase
MKIVIGTQKSKLKTDNPKILKALSNLYSFKIPGAEFTPAYKRRQWDGKKRFFTRGGQFGTGMLPSILADLEKIDCVPELEYKNERPESLPLKSIDPFTYFDYQHESIRHALDNHRCIIKAPTGAGKTLIMAGIVKSLMGKKMVILFNAKSLLKQTYDFFVNECGFNNVGVCFGEGYEDGDIMLCTVQSIERIIDNYVTDAEVLMVDEVHEFANGEFTVAAIESFPNAPYRYGFTATVPQDPIPRWTLISAFGPIYTCRTTQDLIEDNVLTKPIIQMLQVPESEVDDSELGYRGVYEELIVNNETRNNMIKDIVDDIRSNHEQARILVLVRDLEHGHILQEGIGGSCYFLRGEDDLGSRYETIRRFTECGENSILIGTKILQTGVNIREITHFINARGLKSPIATIQALGRSLRRHDTKEVVYVYDFMDTGKYIAAHANKRFSTYVSEGHEVIKI